MIPSRIKLFLLLFFTGIVVPALFAQGYSIKFRINGLKDTTVMIANYYGNGTYIKDTIKVDNSGRFTYKAPDDLPKGIYLVVVNEKNYFELIIDKDREFSMETNKDKLVDNMTVIDSPENKLFYDYLMFNRTKFQEIKRITDLQTQMKDNKDTVVVLDNEVEKINSEIIKYKLSLIEKYPASFVAFFINAMREPEIPEIPILANGRKDSTFAYRYYKNHFWEGTIFTDDRLLRTPVFHNKLMKYFDKIIVQTPDSIIKEANRLIELARPNPEMFKYMVWFTTWHYENSEVMGFDEIFVHIVETYYATNQTPWVNATVRDNIVKKAAKLKPILIGSKAPNLIMMDTSNQFVSMYDIKANILILLFWDPDCGHCEQEVPKLRSFYDENKEKYGIEIMSVCSDSSLVKWKNSINKRKMNFINVNGPRSLTGNYHDQYDIQTTPVIFILNERKEIIAKHLKTEQISQFIKNYSKLK